MSVSRSARCASRAATYPDSLRQARQDLQGTLARHGYRLTDEETRLVEGVAAADR